MFRAYFDDSGTHVGGAVGASRIVAVGGVVAKDEQWDLFNDAWTSILARKNLPYFHMTKFKAGRQSPYCDMSDAEKETLLDQLMRLIGARAILTFSSAVIVADYDVVLTQEEKDRYGSPYAWAAQMCWTIIRLWAERHNYDDPIPFVVESGTRHEDQLSAVFNKTVNNPLLKKLYRLDSMTCGEKQRFPGLQAADIIANSTYEIADHYEAGGRPPSKWMNIVSKYINGIEHRDIIADAMILRSETDSLNEYYSNLAIASEDSANG
jgi:hypothetical protein